MPSNSFPIRPKSADQAAYLSFFFRSPAFYKYRDAIARGANIQNLRFSLFEEIQLEIPAGQKRIARLLEQADRLRRICRYALELSDVFLPAAFLEFFGDLRQNDHHWSFVELETHAEIASGVAKGQKYGNRETVEVPYLRVANVQDGYLDLSEIKAITALPTDVESLRLKAGDIVMTEGGDFDKLGRGAIWPGGIANCIHQNHIFRVRLDRAKLLPTFFAAFLRSPIAKDYFLRCSKQTTNLASINMTQLRATPVPLPPLVKQQHFAKLVTRHEHLRASQREALRQAEHLLQTLLRRAFTDGLEAEIPALSLVSQPSSQEIFSRRHAVACYIVDGLHQSPTFGRTQLMKCLYSTEAHLNIDLGGHYERQAAGPFDKSIYLLEKEAKRQRWFDSQEARTRKGYPQTRYSPLSALQHKVDEAIAILGDKREEFDRILTLFKPLTTREAEIIATLFAAWNDYLLQKISPIDEQIIREVLENWHEAKAKFSRSELQSRLNWMRSNRFVPSGTGPRTIPSL